MPRQHSPEHDEQCAVIQWCKLMSNACPELGLIFSIPNGAKLPYVRNSKGQRYSPQANWLLAEGLHPGVPDLMLPVARHGFHGLFVEMKVKGNKPTDDQTQMIESLGEQGYQVAVCYGAEAAIEEIKEYLELIDA